MIALGLSSHDLAQGRPYTERDEKEDGEQRFEGGGHLSPSPAIFFLIMAVLDTAIVTMPASSAGMMRVGENGSPEQVRR